MTRITTPITLQQSVFSQQALWLRNRFDAICEILGTRPFNQGTPARKHAITDRAARKAEARRRASSGEIVAAFAKPGLHPHQRRIRPDTGACASDPNGSVVTVFDPAATYGAGTVAIDQNGDVYAIAAEKMLKPNKKTEDHLARYPKLPLVAPFDAPRDPLVPTHVVVQGTEGWHVALAIHDEYTVVRGPYAAKKTANRVARTLNGG